MRQKFVKNITWNKHFTHELLKDSVLTHVGRRGSAGLAPHARTAGAPPFAGSVSSMGRPKAVLGWAAGGGTREGVGLVPLFVRVLVGLFDLEFGRRDVAGSPGGIDRGPRPGLAPAGHPRVWSDSGRFGRGPDPDPAAPPARGPGWPRGVVVRIVSGSRVAGVLAAVTAGRSTPLTPIRTLVRRLRGHHVETFIGIITQVLVIDVGGGLHPLAEASAALGFGGLPARLLLVIGRSILIRLIGASRAAAVAEGL